MVLTKEQKERIRKNRERALQIQKERREKEEKNKTIEESIEAPKNLITKNNTIAPLAITASQSTGTKEERDFYSSEPLEDFEEGASEWVTKTEAMNIYCLPEGSIAVCSYEEKKNPRNPAFKPMKLYKRSEIRYRAHKRHGGLEGLINERNKRRKRKLDKEMEAARDIFK